MKQNKILAVWLELVAVLTAFVVGGLFVAKSTTGNVVLGYIPEAVHPIVGWLIIGVAGVLGVMGIWAKLKKK